MEKTLGPRPALGISNKSKEPFVREHVGASNNGAPPGTALPMDARLAARPPRARATVRLPFASSTATRRAGWWCPRDPRVDSSGGGTFPSPGRCPRLAVAHRNRSPAANLGLPPPRPLLPRLPAAGIRTRVTGEGDCEGRPLVECTGDRSVEEQPEHAGG